MKRLLALTILAIISNYAFAGELRAVSATEFVWVDKGETVVNIPETELNNWNVKRIDGFYIGLITKRGDVIPRDTGLTVDNVDSLISIQKALIPYLSAYGKKYSGLIWITAR